MLLNIKHLYGIKIAASDCIVGEVKDFYFDDKTWVIRYLVADTGLWLPGRLVLISPHAFGQFDHDGKLLNITGYRIQTVDGSIGHVSGLLVEDTSWAIRELVVEAAPWYWDKEILISHSKIERIDYEESKVFVTLTKADIKRTAEHDLAKAGTRNS